MAIDTAEKRRSLSGISLPCFAPGVTPNAGKDQEWRQQAAWSYSGILAWAGAAFTWSWFLEAYISAAWVDITPDVLTHDHPTTASRGIQGHGVTNRVASPGSLTTTLDNGSSNSAGLDGYYSLSHANKRPNFGRETRVRLKFVFNGAVYYKWHGWIRALDPTPNRFGKRESFLSAVDYMQKLVEHKLSGIAVQENKRSDQLFQTVIDNVVTAPLNTSIAVDTFTTPFALHSEQDEKSTAMSVIQKICETFMAYAYVRGNATDGETLVFQRELARMTAAPQATFDNTMSELQLEDEPDRVRNKIVGSILNARVDDGADTLLAELTQDYPLDAGDAQTIKLRLRDPSGGANRISAKNIVTALVPGTHYRMSAHDNSELDDMNSLLGISFAPGGNTVIASVTNNGGVRGYINMIRVYGDGIYLYDPVDDTVQNGAADKALTYDFHYLSDPYKARDFLAVILRRTSAGNVEVERLSFLADYNSTLMGYAMNLDIGDRVLIQEYMTGLNGEYTINHVTYTCNTNGTLRVDFELEFAETLSFFMPDDTVLGVMDDADNLLSPF